MQPIDRTAIVNYFKPFPTWAVWMIIIGVPLLFARGFGLIFIAIGVIGIVLYSRGRPSDKQMDDWFTEEMKALNERALKKIGFDPADCVAPSEPIYGPRVQNTGGALVLMRKGGDNLIRYTPIDFTMLNFGQDQLVCYQCSYDRTTGNVLAESTDEYFYRDVVSVSTKSETMAVSFSTGLKGKQESVQLKTAESFVLTTSGGTAIRVFLRDEALLQLKATRGGQLKSTDAEKTIQSIRRMLRDKKGSGPTQSAPPAMPPAMPASNPTSGGDKLQKLKKLLDDGLITPEEFQAEKQKVLGSL